MTSRKTTAAELVNSVTEYQQRRLDLLQIRPLDPDGIPLPPDELIALPGVIIPEQRAYAEWLVKTKREGTIDARITAALLVRGIRSQGKNRDPNYPHVGGVAWEMQPGKIGKGFEPSMTQIVFELSGYGANGGHSFRAVVQSTMPARFWTDFQLYRSRTQRMVEIDGKMEADLDEFGNVQWDDVYTLPPLEYADADDPTGCKEIPFVDVEGFDDMTEAEKLAIYDTYLEAIPEDKRFLRIAINAPLDIVRRLDTRQRGRYGEEALSLFGPAKVELPKVDLFAQRAKVYSACFRQFWLCSKTDPSEFTSKDKDTYTKYGTIAGGGNTGAQVYPVIYLTIDPLMRKNFALSQLQVDDAGELKLPEKYSILRRRQKDVLTALLRLDPTGAERLGQVLRADATSKALEILINKMTQAEKNRDLKGLATPGIVQAYLIAVGNQGVPVEPKDHPTHTPIEHQTICRGRGWDRGDENDEGESFADVFAWSENAVEQWYIETGKKDATPKPSMRKGGKGKGKKA